MTEAEIYPRLTQVLRDVFLRDDLVATPELNAAALPAWDSMKHIDIVLSVEERFSLTFTSMEIDQLLKIGDFVALIMRKAR